MSGKARAQAGTMPAGGDGQTASVDLLVTVMSFGYKQNPAPAANLLFDVRFLKNPYWVEELRPLTGLDRPVRDYVLGQKPAEEFLLHVTGLLRAVLPQYQALAAGNVTVALGCTGGQHRSAALAEELARRIAAMPENYQVVCCHRELNVERSAGR